ncbi:MAG: NADH-quinone oxidoreductase subunit L [Spirochaetia bacterium]|nr:NADH-quinone oxidoreductase subunit L [Spirochaetia bacterium]
MNEILLIAAIWLPFLGFLANGLLSLKKEPASQKLVSIFGVGSVLISFLIFIFLTFAENTAIVSQSGFSAMFFTWINVGTLSADFAYKLDGLSVFMAWIVTGIGMLIHIYSTGYMEEEKPHFARFFAYLNLFIFAMLHLVLGDSLPLLFLGWEGVGLCSYLLIGFDYDKDFAAVAGKKAFITNRIGDAGFIIGMFLLFQLTGSLKYDEIYGFFGANSVDASTLNIIALCLFVGAMGKSAQIPLYVWLPDAMAGPTPVSALIHAATMVTAGVFMIARLAPVFLGAPEASTVIAFVGGFTALLSALIALTQTDIKKVLAYSTVSQLGYMFMAMGVGAYGAGMFHLMTHAFFKALLFLGSGAVILALHHEQDMRRMGGLYKHVKLLAILFWVAAVAISGIPGLSGFFSKDMILEMAYTFANGGKILFLLGFMTAILTSFYIFRLIFLTFHTSGDAVKKMEEGGSHGHGHDEHGHHSHHSGLVPLGWNIMGPLVVLGVLSVFGGYVGLPHIITHKTPGIVGYFDQVLSVAPSKAAESWHQHIEGSTAWLLMLASIGVAFLGLFTAWFFYQKQNKVPAEDSVKRSFFVHLSFNKFFVDEIYEKILLNPLKKIADLSYKIIDVKIIDASIDYLGKITLLIGSYMRRLQTGVTPNYALYIVSGTVVIAFIVFGGLN